MSELVTAALVFALVSGAYLALHAVAEVFAEPLEPRARTGRAVTNALLLAMFDLAQRRRWIFVAAAIIAVPLSW